jgi:hypothetical protein
MVVGRVAEHSLATNRLGRKRSLRYLLDLCETAIHKQFRSSDIAVVVRRQKHHSFGSLIERSKLSRYQSPQSLDRKSIPASAGNANRFAFARSGMPMSRETAHPLHKGRSEYLRN